MKVKNPRNILKYHDRFDMNIKQKIFLWAGIGIFAAVGFLLNIVLPLITSFVLSGLFSLPCLLSATLKINGLEFYKVIKLTLDILSGKYYRKYKTRGFKN